MHFVTEEKEEEEIESGIFPKIGMADMLVMQMSGAVKTAGDSIVLLTCKQFLKEEQAVSMFLDFLSGFLS